MRQHMNQARKLMQDSTKKSTTLASHFALVLQNFPNPPNKLILNTVKIHKSWQANPISCVPTFGTPRCHLCNHEKLAIFHMWRTHSAKLINKRKELTSKCRHSSVVKTHFFHQQRNEQTMETNRLIMRRTSATHCGRNCHSFLQLSCDTLATKLRDSNERLDKVPSIERAPLQHRGAVGVPPHLSCSI